jgi:prepilin-type N-terminal cleavage/methylation domain-containing protein
MMVKKDRGVTLIELMIVLVIAAFLVAGIYSLFITQHRSYSVQDQVAGVQQDARVALDIMARDIRMAGFLTGAGSGTGFDGISVNTHNYAVEPNNGGTSSTDQITLVFAAEQATTVTNVADKQVTLDTGGGSHFNLTDKAYVAFEGENNLYQIDPASGTGDILTLTNSPPASLDDPGFGTHAYLVKAIKYSLTALDGSPGVGVLRRNENTGGGAQPLAGDGITTFVEDLQFTYQVQGQADPTLWYNTPAAAGATNDAIRMVRIDLVVRTAVLDPKDTTFTQPPLRDHTSGLNGPDGFRRRVYTTVVKVRNLK